MIIHSGAPQFSNVSVVGNLGLNVVDRVGFDISSIGTNFVTNGNDLYTINLTTGALTPIGTIGGSLSVATIAVVVPGPASAALGAMGALFAARRRRR